MIFWGCLVFSREFRRPKRAKTKICFTFGAFVVLLSSSFVVAVVVSTGCRWCRVQGLPVSCGVCSLLLFALLLFPWCIGLKYALISQFKAVFSGFWGWCVGLYRLRALLGLWGFCVREWLGGFGACGVFRLSFSSFLLLSSLFLLSFCSCPASLLGFCSWSLGLLVLWLLAFFPFRTTSAQKEGARIASLPAVCYWLVVRVRNRWPTYLVLNIPL